MSTFPWRRDIVPAPNQPDTDTAVVLQMTNGVPTVSSRDIADQFGKRHADVLRDINELELDAEMRSTWYCNDHYTAENGKSNPMVHMTKDGFTFLCMGWTGSKAAAFKVRYIQAFNKMEADLRNAPTAAPDIGRLERMVEQLIGLVSAMVTSAKPAPKSTIAAPVPTRQYDVLDDPLAPEEMMTAGSWLSRRGEYKHGNNLGSKAYQMARKEGIAIQRRDLPPYQGQPRYLWVYPVSLLARAWAIQKQRPLRRRHA